LGLSAAMKASGVESFWDRRADAWCRHLHAIDEHLATYGVPALEALNVSAGDRVIDVGCGPGRTTAELAWRVHPGGEVFGVDVSSAMIQLARRVSQRAGVRFCVADAQSDDLGCDFDAAYARFSVMFFTDHVAGLAKVRRALRPGGRLACVTWAPLRDNPWIYLPALAAGPLLGRALQLPGPGVSDPFDLSRPEEIRDVMDRAGFIDVSVTPIAGARVLTPRSVRTEITGLLEEGGPLAELWATADQPTRDACIEKVLGALEPYREPAGWRLPGTAMSTVASCPG
jgi:ubiquinone/menaquinone biosynthesis C-methylase UbiE